MKRLFFILFFFGVVFLCACGRQEKILEYQEGDISAQCVINGKYGVLLEKRGGEVTLTVTEPDYANGITFVLGESVAASVGDTKIDLDRETVKGICALGETFSQREECLIGASSGEEGSVLTFQREGCLYRLTLGKNSLPKQVYISSESFEYNVEIVSIELT